MKFIRLCFLATALIAFALPAHATRSKPTRPTPASTPAAKPVVKPAATQEICRYKGYIVIDAASGQILSEENADTSNPPASMTKLMTFAVVTDKLKTGEITLGTPVRIDRSDMSMGGTQVYLDERETFTVEELIYAMMIQSANDAAHALARITAGSVPLFVEQMNTKARELGMTHTTFRTPHGLPPPSRKISEGDLTTPRDFAILCRYLVTKTDVLKYSCIRERDFGPNRPKGPLHMKNHNNLIDRVIGVDGLKTGYTAAAGYCLSATAQRNGRRVVAVIMGCFGPNGEIDKGASRDRKMIDMLERGFATLSSGAKPAAPTPAQIQPKPAATATKSTAAKPTAASKVPGAAKPAPAPAAPAIPAEPPSPVGTPDSSPVQPDTASPVAPVAAAPEPAPSVKFVLPAKKP